MSKKIFYSTKTYGNDRGLSCCFRQWRSTHSHCSLWHGYSIGIKLVFGCEDLDERNWVFDFGGLKEFKKWSEHMFDHTLAIAEDDPHKDATVAFAQATGIADIRIVPGVGCERFAELCFDKMNSIIDEGKVNGTLLNPTVFLDSVEVFEHGANSAICKRDSTVHTSGLSKINPKDEIAQGDTNRKVKLPTVDAPANSQSTKPPIDVEKTIDQIENGVVLAARILKSLIKK